jgi:hypothetical protein
MRRLTSLLVLFLLITTGYGQVMKDDSLFSGGEPMLQPKKLNYSFTLGSQFTSVSGNGSALNTYITPRFSYNLNKRFSIGGGVSIIQTNYFQARSYFQNEQSPNSNGNFTSAMIFIDGQYNLNNRLSIYGSAYKQFPVTQDPLPYNPFNPVSSRGAQGVNFNVSYKIGEHVFIEAGFLYSEGSNPWYADPFSRTPFLNNNYGPPSSFGIPRW